ncbi:hypothetical protein [Candidatus Berkiella aquae]|uniref:Internalin-J n=1 Tax=Candidatus Berkiella aquae TaxID=295108 RepID=A0A0Q9YWD6_9GAMM|nr:hypothetical protein [Candidatus Berkiella aquae]MCS5710475.1 hypothetical protein [Candidatus Berkiella aquae]
MQQGPADNISIVSDPLMEDILTRLNAKKMDDYLKETMLILSVSQYFEIQHFQAIKEELNAKIGTQYSELLEKLKEIDSIASNSKQFWERDALLDAINIALIKSCIDINCSVLIVSRQNLTRFPWSIFEEETLKNYWTKLIMINCSDNNLSNLTFRNCDALQILLCSNNQLSVLDINDCHDLRHIDCQNNSLRNIDFTDLTRLKILICSHNQLNMLVLESCKELVELVCNGNLLDSLNVTFNPMLKDLTYDYAKTSLKGMARIPPAMILKMKEHLSVTEKETVKSSRKWPFSIDSCRRFSEKEKQRRKP